METVIGVGDNGSETIIALDDKQIRYDKLHKQAISKDKFYIIFFFIVLILIVSFSYTLLFSFEWEPLMVLEKYKRIKKNTNSWMSILYEKTGIEVNKGKLLYLSKPEVANWQCVDLSSYYTPVRISPSSYLPEFIQRGNSGPWTVRKTGTGDDVASLQFCQFLIDKYVTQGSGNVITCGIDMFEKLGYGGYFNTNSPCEKVYNTLVAE